MELWLGEKKIQSVVMMSQMSRYLKVVAFEIFLSGRYFVFSFFAECMPESNCRNRSTAWDRSCIVGENLQEGQGMCSQYSECSQCTFIIRCMQNVSLLSFWENQKLNTYLKTVFVCNLNLLHEPNTLAQKYTSSFFSHCQITLEISLKFTNSVFACAISQLK